MNQTKDKKSKQISKKLEPLKTLPKFKNLQDENQLLTQTSENTKSKIQLSVIANFNHDTKSQKDPEKTTKEEGEGETKQNSTGHGSVEFVSQNQKHLICEDLLRLGYLESFHDFFSLVLENEHKLGDKQIVIEKTLNELKEQLMRIEDENSKGNYEQILTSYTQIAEKYLESKVENAARFFFEKVIVLLHSYLEETKISPEVYFQNFINSKLGLVKCYDFETEAFEALTILEEIYAKTSKIDDYRAEIAFQLISLYQKLGTTEEKNKSYENAANYYQKCLLICVENNMQKEECLLILKIGRLYKKMNKIEEAIQVIKSHRSKNIKLPKEFSVRFEISSFKLLAKCYEKLQDLEEAENNYKNFYELLKLNEENKESFDGKPSLKLGDIYWRKENYKEGLKYYSDYFEEGLKSKVKNREIINHARVTLSVAKGFDEFENFLEYFQMSKNKIDDIIVFKKHRRIL